VRKACGGNSQNDHAQNDFWHSGDQQLLENNQICYVDAHASHVGIGDEWKGEIEHKSHQTTFHRHLSPTILRQYDGIVAFEPIEIILRSFGLRSFDHHLILLVDSGLIVGFSQIPVNWKMRALISKSYLYPL
jgi:hypothetical protein